MTVTYKASFTRFTAVILCLLLCFAVGCSSETAAGSVSSAPEKKQAPVSSVSEPTKEQSTAPSECPPVSQKETSSVIPKPVPINSVQTIIDDMKLPHEGLPHGVPLYYSWAEKPRVGVGIHPGEHLSFTIWGQVYEDEIGNPAKNSRVQLRSMQAYYYSKSQGKWIELQNSSDIYGSAFKEDFADNVSVAPRVRNESKNGGGISVTAGGGYNFHFWPLDPRAKIDDPDDMLAIYSTVQARLILHDPDKADDRSEARYLLSVGGDYWLSDTTKWDGENSNVDFAMGRFKYVTAEWQAFNAWAGDEDLIRSNPPPFE